MATINCIVRVFLKYIPVFKLAENSMTGRAYMGEMLTQIWLKSIEMSELFEFEKFAGFTQTPSSPQK